MKFLAEISIPRVNYLRILMASRAENSISEMKQELEAD
jgi:hypothetical protein